VRATLPLSPRALPAALLGVAISWCANSRPVEARDEPGLRIAIVLDDSGSMQTTDPRRLSVAAAMIAVGLASPEDRLAVVPLDGAPSGLAPGGPSPALLEHLRGLARRAARTLYDRPLRRALRLLGGGGAGAGGRRIILFLTDGEPDAAGLPGPERVLLAQDAFLRELPHLARGASLFPVVLGSLGQKWQSLLDEAASRTGGRSYRVAESGDKLIEAFADIYARQLGSRVVVRDLPEGESRLASLDDFVRFANLVILSRGGAFTVSAPGRPGAATASTESGLDPRWREHGGSTTHHFVQKLSTAGGPEVLAVKLSGGGTYRALLIWDYDLAFGLDAPRADDAGGGFVLSAHLDRRSSSEPIEKEAFLRGMDVRARIWDGPCAVRSAATAPASVLALPLVCGSAVAGGRVCRFEARFSPPRPGTTCVDALARRSHEGHLVLELESAERHELRAVGGARLALVSTKPLAFALDQNGPAPWRSCARLDVSTDGVRRPATVRVIARSLGLPAGAALLLDGARTDRFELRPASSPRRLELCVEAGAPVPRPGLFVPAGRVVLEVVDATWFAPDGRRAEAGAELRITARTFWNTYRRLLLGLGLGLLGLLLLVWLVRGFVSPFAFPEALRVNWGQTQERLDRNEMPVSEIPGTGRGFYHNARLHVGGPRCFVQSGGPPVARFEATGRGRISLFPEEGVQAVRVNKFDSSQREPVTGGTVVGLDEVYRVGDLFVRLR
jgi:hypothetical protein